MAKARPIEERFWEKVDRSGGLDACWLWRGSCAGKNWDKGGGYGILKRDRSASNIRAHHLSWMLHNGEIPDGMNVLHRCDVTRCVNPDHLWLGTHAENQADKKSKGRGRGESRPGSKTATAKLTEADIPEIRRLYFEGASQSEVARRFGITRGSIAQIVEGKAWTHVPFDPAHRISDEERQRRINEGAHKLRGRKGAHNGASINTAKLTEADIPVIRQMHKDGSTQVEIARKYGITHVSVGAIIRGQTWKHVQ